MSERRKIRVAILKALRAADGVPMPDDSLVGAAMIGTFPRPTISEVRSVGQDMELEGLLSSVSDAQLGVQWGLTAAGKLAAQQL